YHDQKSDTDSISASVDTTRDIFSVPVIATVNATETSCQSPW
ncbi:unnamed protein product, partial [Adineta ricciae]